MRLFLLLCMGVMVLPYRKAMLAAVEWHPVAWPEHFSPQAAIALWQDYVRTALVPGRSVIPGGLMWRGKEYGGVIPLWRLMAAGIGLGLSPQNLAGLAVELPPLVVTDLPGLGELVQRLAGHPLGALPIYDPLGDRWGLLSLGNLIRQLSLEALWNPLPLGPLPPPPVWLENPVSLAALVEQGDRHQTLALPLGETSEPALLTLWDGLALFDPVALTFPGDGLLSPPSAFARSRPIRTYGQAHRRLSSQYHDYLLLPVDSPPGWAWLPPHQWATTFSPDNLLQALNRAVDPKRVTPWPSLVEAIADGLLVVNGAGQVVFANGVACTMFALRQDQLLQSHLGLDPAAPPTEMSICLPGDRVGRGELHCQPIEWQGEPAHLITLRDVTDRQQLVEQLQAREEQYRHLLETLPNLVWQLSPSGALRDCNQRTLDYLGQSLTTVQGDGWQRFIHPDEMAWTVAQWQKGVKEGRFFQLEYRLRRADGSYRWQFLQMLPLPDREGRATGWLGSSTEIESLKQSENLLRQQAQQEKLLADVGQKIRQSLSLDQILRNAVQEVRRTLGADRVLVYQVYSNGTGRAIAEAVAKGYKSVMDMVFPEEVFPQECYDRYVQGYVYSLTDRETEFVVDCLVEFLALIGVRAKLVVPIVFSQQLWGLLIAHQCSRPRVWQTHEVQLLKSLGNQLAIAIQQALLYERLTQELVERTKAEQQLRELNQLQQGILDGANYLIMSTDTQGNILTFNRRAESLLGYGAAEVVGHLSLLHFHDPDELQTRACYWAETLHCTLDPHRLEVLTLPALRLGVYEDEWTYFTQSGDHLPVRLSITALRDETGTPNGWVAIASDLRAQKQMEAERQTLDFVVTNSTELIVITDLDQNIIFLNRAGQELLGLSSAPAIADPPLSHYITPDGSPQWERDILPHLFQTGTWEGELTLSPAASGQAIPVTASIFLRNDPQTHQPLNLIGIMHDITHIKQAEAQILESLESEKRLSELRSRFIAMASHEFRTPLAIISSSTSILGSYYDRLTADKRQQHFQRIQNSVKNMTLLLDDVLTINRAEAQGLQFTPQEQDLLGFCLALREELQISHGGREILFVAPPPPFLATFDPTLLKQILTNLLSNALKYSAPTDPVSFTLHQDDHALIFTIQDHGIGIPADELDQVFDSFYRGHNVGTIQGTGLGLAIVQKCIDLHGGTITVTSSPGAGTCCEVRLPLVVRFDRRQ